MHFNSLFLRLQASHFISSSLPKQQPKVTIDGWLDTFYMLLHRGGMCCLGLEEMIIDVWQYVENWCPEVDDRQVEKSRRQRLLCNLKDEYSKVLYVVAHTEHLSRMLAMYRIMFLTDTESLTERSVMGGCSLLETSFLKVQDAEYSVQERRGWTDCRVSSAGIRQCNNWSIVNTSHWGRLTLAWFPRNIAQVLFDEPADVGLLGQMDDPNRWDLQ